MRMRRKKNLDGRLAAKEALFVKTPEKTRGNWSEMTCGRPVFVEIGCGKGRFICQLAHEHPEYFFVAAEKYANVCVLAAERADAMGIDNLLFLCEDAARLGEFFAQGEIAGIYINFCDPWPAKRHAKRRLTHRGMLEIYSRLLGENGQIRLKTDAPHLFEFSLCELSHAGFELLDVSLDLHSSGAQNISTEYEQKFSRMGVKILALTAQKPR